jgi:hypothetical protein
MQVVPKKLKSTSQIDFSLSSPFLLLINYLAHQLKFNRFQHIAWHLANLLDKEVKHRRLDSARDFLQHRVEFELHVIELVN